MIIKKKTKWNELTRIYHCVNMITLSRETKWHLPPTLVQLSPTNPVILSSYKHWHFWKKKNLDQSLYESQRCKTSHCRRRFVGIKWHANTILMRKCIEIRIIVAFIAWIHHHRAPRYICFIAKTNTVRPPSVPAAHKNVFFSLPMASIRSSTGSPIWFWRQTDVYTFTLTILTWPTHFLVCFPTESYCGWLVQLNYVTLGRKDSWHWMGTGSSYCQMWHQLMSSPIYWRKICVK